MYTKQNICKSIIMLNNIFRQLWEQHIMWTRSFIISTVDDLKDLEYVTKRLLKNPNDFADLFNTFYGSEKSNKFQKLFEEHLLIAADLVNQAKNNNTEKINETREKWYKNADEISEFLSSINVFWEKEQWQKMLYEHLKMTENEAVTRIEKQFQENIDIYDEIENQALKMADYMSQGIWKQFRD